MKNLIGLDTEKTQLVASKLNGLLADYQVFYQNLRGFHWNIKGKSFFEMHEKFEKYYNDANEKIDEIAERILTLEVEPKHTFSAYLQASSIEEAQGVGDGGQAVGLIVQTLSALLVKEREILSLAGEAGDEGTVALMSEYISETEKSLWMLNSYLK